MSSCASRLAVIVTEDWTDIEGREVQESKSSRGCGWDSISGI